jgi:MinD-like ATPase involved in chromosome partitioning or flagellar assembly
MTKIISVIQLKGGAGKSTVVTNLAAMLVEKAKKG